MLEEDGITSVKKHVKVVVEPAMFPEEGSFPGKKLVRAVVEPAVREEKGNSPVKSFVVDEQCGSTNASAMLEEKGRLGNKQCSRNA